MKAHSPKRASDIGKHASRRRFGLVPAPAASSLFLAVKRHAHEGNNAERRRAQQHVEEALCARRGRNKTKQQRWCHGGAHLTNQRNGCDCGSAFCGARVFEHHVVGGRAHRKTHTQAHNRQTDDEQNCVCAVQAYEREEVYVKRGNGLPEGWALDETGHDSTDPNRVLKNIIAKAGGGILPLGGSGELTSGYKGYGFAMLCEICTAILSGGTTSNYIYKTPGRANIAQCFIALDYGMFGDKKAIREALDRYLQEIRDSDKAEGQERIFIHGEKSAEARERVLREGVSLNEKTYEEMKMIAAYTGAEAYLPPYLD